MFLDQLFIKMLHIAENGGTSGFYADRSSEFLHILLALGVVQWIFVNNSSGSWFSFG